MSIELIATTIVLPVKPDLARLNVKCSQCENRSVYAYIDDDGEILTPTWCNICEKKTRLKEKLFKVIELYWTRASTEQIEEAIQEFESAISRY